MHYIYLNHYRAKNGNKYLYIGSHGWEGDGIDPSHTGESHVAKHFNWKPYKIKILEVVSEERRYIAEKEWIEWYALQYGIADCAAQYTDSDRWVSKFPRHGLLLNLHSNTAEHCHTTEVRRKAYRTMVERGTYDNVLKANHSKEALAKRHQTRVQNGALERWVQATHTPEAKAKSVATRRVNGALDKAVKAAQAPEVRARRRQTCIERGIYQNLSALGRSHFTEETRAKARATRLSHCQKAQLSDGFIGNYIEISEHLGITIGSAGAAISNAHSLGATYTIKRGPHKGMSFTPVY